MTTITVQIELDHLKGSIDNAIAKNMGAMKWAIDNCPAQYLAPLVDNRAILEKVFFVYLKQVQEVDTK